MFVRFPSDSLADAITSSYKARRLLVCYKVSILRKSTNKHADNRLDVIEPNS